MIYAAHPLLFARVVSEEVLHSTALNNPTIQHRLDSRSRQQSRVRVIALDYIFHHLDDRRRSPAFALLLCRQEGLSALIGGDKFLAPIVEVTFRLPRCIVTGESAPLQGEHGAVGDLD